jgi:hypothetical protein
MEKYFFVIIQNLDFSFLLKLKACLTLDTKMECLSSGPALYGEKFRQTIWDKSAQCYWEHPWEKHIENLRNTIGNMVKHKKKFEFCACISPNYEGTSVVLVLHPCRQG